jgi:hypothetical protein
MRATASAATTAPAAPTARKGMAAGHYIPEELPQETAARLQAFFSA